MGFFGDLFERIKGALGMKPKEEKVEVMQPIEEPIVQGEEQFEVVPEKKNIANEFTKIVKERAIAPVAVRAGTRTGMSQTQTRIDVPKTEQEKVMDKVKEREIKYKRVKDFSEFERSKVDDMIVNQVKTSGRVLLEGNVYDTYKKLFKSKAKDLMDDDEVSNILFENRDKLKHRFSCLLLVTGKDSSDNKTHIKAQAELVGALPEDVAAIFNEIVGQTYTSDKLYKEIMSIGRKVARNVNVDFSYPCTVESIDVHTSFS